jgi:hypothetical protein
LLLLWFLWESWKIIFKICKILFKHINNSRVGCTRKFFHPIKTRYKNGYIIIWGLKWSR